MTLTVCAVFYTVRERRRKRMREIMVAELQFELDRHNLRVTVAQTRKAQMDEKLEKEFQLLEDGYHGHLDGASVCMMCLEEVEQDILLEDFGYIFTQADMLGTESLTEHEQVVLEGRLCGQDCYYAMQDAEFDFRERQRRAANIEANGDTTFYGGPEGGE
jgi:hypothetical protein